MWHTKTMLRTADALSKLFTLEQFTCSGNAYATDVYPIANLPKAEFFCINPLSNSLDHQKDRETGEISVIAGSRRADLNVVSFKNFLFEMDNMPMIDQMKFWKNSKIKPTTLVFSGGKSYHAIISLEVPLNVTPHTIEALETYKSVWSGLATLLATDQNKDPSIFDSSCKNPSRLSRYPNAVRNNVVTQSLISIGPLAKPDLVQKALARTGHINSQSSYVKKVKTLPKTSEEMRLMMPTELLNRLKFPATWAAPAGMYPELFKLTLWAIDSTGVEFDTFLDFLTKHTFPGLLKVGYPKSKLQKPIKDAYASKGISTRGKL